MGCDGASRRALVVIARIHESKAERVAKYEAYALRLESVRADYIRRTPLYAKSFVALTIAGFACFAFGGLVGIWGSISATSVSVVGYAMLGVRVRELAAEIKAVRQDAERMRCSESR